MFGIVSHRPNGGDECRNFVMCSEGLFVQSLREKFATLKGNKKSAERYAKTDLAMTTK